MALNDFFNRDLRVGSTPDIPESEENYYPDPGIVFRLAHLPDAGLLEFTSPAQVLPPTWLGSRYIKIEPDSRGGPDPFFKDVGVDKERLYGVVYLLDRFFHVWFVEEMVDQSAVLGCYTRSLPATAFDEILTGGYKVN